MGKELRRNLLVLLGAVGLILLLACANLANLMLSRAMLRQKELAVRKALGASRGRLIVQMIVEGLLLSFLGSLLAIGVAYLGIHLLLALKPADLQRPEQVHLSLLVLLFTMAIGTLAGIAFALIPAIYVSKTDVNAVLKDAAPNQRHPGRVRAALVIGEVSLAVVLLIAAVFMIGSLVSVLHVDPGFRRRPRAYHALQHAAIALCEERSVRAFLSAGTGTHHCAARRKVGQLLRRAAHDAYSNDEIHGRWSVHACAWQRAHGRYARHQFAFLLRNARHPYRRRPKLHS